VEELSLLGHSKIKLYMCIKFNTVNETGETLLYFDHVHGETWEICMVCVDTHGETKNIL
jgi:hypothetical protein